LTLSIADWEIDKEGITIYKEPGDSECSASRWISADPAMVSSGDSKLIRVVIRVPENTAPGVYTSAVLVELKRTPWVPDGKGSPTIFEVFTLYVNVRPPGPDRLLSGGN
jgi:hypothetical protein